MDVIQSIALQEAALARILNAEGEKIQAFVEMETISPGEFLELNENARRLVGSVTRLESILQDKLKFASCGLDVCRTDSSVL